MNGRQSSNALLDTTFNFVRTIPLLIILVIITFQNAELTTRGIILASLSGGLTSGVGYTVWYIALKELTSIQAAIVQLTVPVIAALGGVVFVSEPITIRLLISALLILSGIMLVIYDRHRKLQVA